MALGWRSSYLRYREIFLNVFAIYKRRQDVKAFLEIILSTTAIAFFVVLAIRPTLLTIIGLVGEIQAKDAVVSQMDKKINDLAAAQNVFQRENRILLIDSAIPGDPSVETFIGQIQGLSASRSVNILGATVSQVALSGPQVQRIADSHISPLPENSQGISFSLSLSGDYSSLTGFLSDFEKLRRPIQFDSVILSVSKEETSKILILVISGRTPYLKP